MGREVRRVPANWQHPQKRDERTGMLRFHPQYDESYGEACERWKEAFAKWEGGDRSGCASADCEFWEWEGQPPDRDYYRNVEWTDEERTHWQMYETTSEGTPISPVMETPEELARWLADNKASAFAGDTATYEQWLSVILGGSAPSVVIVNGVMESGVAAVARHRQKQEQHDAQS